MPKNAVYGLVVEAKAEAFFDTVADAVCKAEPTAKLVRGAVAIRGEQQGDAVFFTPGGELYIPGPELPGGRFRPSVSVEATYLVPPNGAPHAKMLTVRLRGMLNGGAWADFSEYGLEASDMPSIQGHCQRLWAAFEVAFVASMESPLRE